MLGKKMEKAIDAQINAEIYSAYLYLSMSAYFASENLAGFANWMRQQTKEEMFHAVKMFDYVNARGGRVILQAIDQPPAEWTSAAEVFAEVLSHEQKVTGLINSLVNLALEERDHATNIFLQWFVSEQVEEEASAAEILSRLRMIGNDASALFLLDRELGQRQFVMPAATPQ